VHEISDVTDIWTTLPLERFKTTIHYLSCPRQSNVSMLSLINDGMDPLQRLQPSGKHGLIIV